jgi:uncharacterized ferritin-like protein (DUF455 family)
MDEGGAPRTKVVRGVVVRDDPAREPCFQIVHLHADVPESESGMMTREGRRKRLHREVNQELQTIEIAALSLADFPDAPWDLRMELARQCWDEARHTALYYQRLLAYDGYKGQYAIANLDWSLVAMIDTLAGRLAVQNRTFEAGSLDSETVGIGLYRELGDPETADVMEAIEADEIHHVRFANEWLRRMTAAEPRTVLQVAAAISWLKRVVDATGGAALHDIPTDSEIRHQAGFSAGEIAEVQRLQAQRAAPPPGPPAASPVGA